jgi:superoxide reductase
MVGLIVDKGAPLSCCGEAMKEVVPNTVEASREKHLPVVAFTGGALSVSIGQVEHPMSDEHRIEFVYVETENGGLRRSLNAGDKPFLSVALEDESPVAVYAYCNLHGLWKTDVE